MFYKNATNAFYRILLTCKQSRTNYKEFQYSL